MKFQLVTLICLLVINIMQASSRKMGGVLEDIAANAAEKKVAMIAKDRTEETVETKMGCGCK